MSSKITDNIRESNKNGVDRVEAFRQQRAAFLAERMRADERAEADARQKRLEEEALERTRLRDEALNFLSLQPPEQTSTCPHAGFGVNMAGVCSMCKRGLRAIKKPFFIRRVDNTPLEDKHGRPTNLTMGEAELDKELDTRRRNKRGVKVSRGRR